MIEAVRAATGCRTPTCHSCTSNAATAVAAVLALVERGRPVPQSPWAPTEEPCTGCGDAQADHREQGCIGDFGHCPCETWMPLDGPP
jgi:hypothetical protein